MALTTTVMKRDSVLASAIAAACHTLETAGAIRLHTGGSKGSAEANGQGLMTDWNT